MSDEQKKAFIKALQSNETEYSRLARAAILADIQDEENSMIDKKVIKSYPYFIAWLEELNRSVEEVENISAEAEAIELSPENGWRRYEPPKFMQVGVTFTDGQSVEKRIAISDFTYLAPEEVEQRDEEANRKAHDIYDQEIAPLMEKIDAIAMKHGFSYVAAFQYAEDGIAASCALKASSDETLTSVWELLDKHVIWEKEKVEEEKASWDFYEYSDGYPDSPDEGDE